MSACQWAVKSLPGKAPGWRWLDIRGLASDLLARRIAWAAAGAFLRLGRYHDPLLWLSVPATQAARVLAMASTTAGLLVAPILPGITDDRAGLSKLMAKAKEAGARYVVGSALRLGPAARHRFLPVLASEFPHLADRYERHYGRREGVSAAYQEALSHRLRELQQLHGFPVDEWMSRHRRAERASLQVHEQPSLV